MISQSETIHNLIISQSSTHLFFKLVVYAGQPIKKAVGLKWEGLKQFISDS